MNIDFSKKYKLIYTRSNACGFIQGHIYEMNFIQDKKTKIITGIANYDYTTDENVYLQYPLSSTLSMNRYFINYEGEEGLWT